MLSSSHSPDAACSETQDVPRSGMVWSLSVVGADLVCPRVSTNRRRSLCHRARDGYDDLFCSKIKASRVLGPAARSEGHYAQIRILIRDSISCVARRIVGRQIMAIYL